LLHGVLSDMYCSVHEYTCRNGRIDVGVGQDDAPHHELDAIEHRRPLRSLAGPRGRGWVVLRDG
jgi:hypothetical protein